MFKCKSEASALYSPRSGAPRRQSTTFDCLRLCDRQNLFPTTQFFLHLPLGVPGETVDGISVRRLRSPAPVGLKRRGIISKIVWNKRLARLVFIRMTRLRPAISAGSPPFRPLQTALRWRPAIVHCTQPHALEQKHFYTRRKFCISIPRSEYEWRSAEWGRKRTKRRVSPN